jgi:hypothetical protein
VGRQSLGQRAHPDAGGGRRVGPRCAAHRHNHRRCPCGSGIPSLDLTLRTPDALSIAIAQRASAVPATFDVAMADCARALQTEVLAD